MKKPTIEIVAITKAWMDGFTIHYVITIPRENGETTLSGTAKIGEAIDLELTTNED